jgi:hypothetical protein
LPIHPPLGNFHPSIHTRGGGRRPQARPDLPGNPSRCTHPGCCAPCRTTTTATAATMTRATVEACPPPPDQYGRAPVDPDSYARLSWHRCGTRGGRLVGNLELHLFIVFDVHYAVGASCAASQLPVCVALSKVEPHVHLNAPSATAPSCQCSTPHCTTSTPSPLASRFLISFPFSRVA